MATPIAAYALKVQVAPDSSGTPGTFAAPSNQKDYKISVKAAQADTSQTNSAGYNQRTYTLIDVSGSYDGFTDFSDTAQTTLRNAVLNRSPVWIKAFITATNYVQAQVNVEGMDFGADPGGVSTFSCTFSMAGTGTTPLTVA